MRFELVRSAKSNKRSSLVDLKDRITGEVILTGVRIRNNEANATMMGANAAARHLTRLLEVEPHKTLDDLHKDIEADIQAAKAANQ